MADIPELAYGTVTGRFLAGVLDSADAGKAPDAVPVQGYLEFSATASSLKVHNATPHAATVFPRKIRVDLDTEGYLTHNGARDVTLWATDDQDATPVNWQWRVDFFLSLNSQPIAYPGFYFALPSGGKVDLTKDAPLREVSPGIVIVKGPPGEPGGVMTESRIISLVQSWLDDNITELPGGGPGEDGADGRTPEMRLSGSIVQWHYVGETAWRNLFSIEDLRGTAGAPGAPGAPGTTHIWVVRWNGSEWVNPVPPAGVIIRIFEPGAYTNVTKYNGATISGVTDYYAEPTTI